MGGGGLGLAAQQNQAPIADPFAPSGEHQQMQ